MEVLNTQTDGSDGTVGTDSTTLLKLLSQADTLPFIIPSHSLLSFASRCMGLVGRFHAIISRESSTSRVSHGKDPQIHIWDIYSLSTTCDSILNEYDQYYGDVDSTNSNSEGTLSRSSRQSQAQTQSQTGKVVAKAPSLVKSLVTRIRQDIHVQLCDMKENSTQFRNNTIKFLMKK